MHLRVKRSPPLAAPTAGEEVRAYRDDCPLWWGGVHWRSAVPFDALRFPATSWEGRAAEWTEDRKPLCASSRSDVSLFDVTHTEFAVYLEQLCVVGLSY